MEEEKTLLDELAAEDYDAADRPFDFVGEGGATALVCEPDPAVRDKIVGALREMNYQITKPATAKEAIKYMRFHVYDVVVLNELFDREDKAANDVPNYLAGLAMTTRRKIFVVLVSEKYRTMDNMAAFNNSVNLILNLKNIDETGKIIKRGISDNAAFYHVFRETLQKMGKA
jgi:DNA-binding NtrC family response regulator